MSDAGFPRSISPTRSSNQLVAASVVSGISVSELRPSDHSLSDPVDVDTRAMLEWMRKTLKLKGCTPEKWTEEHDSVAIQFLTSVEVRKLVAYMSTEGELCMLTPYSSFSTAPKSFCYWIRKDSGTPLTSATIKTAVQFGFVNGGGMDSLLRLMQDVYLPTMKTTDIWPESVRKDFLGQLHRFLASVVETSFQAQGKTVLYLPAESFSTEIGVSASDKDLVQRLEATVIHWTRQIKEVVSHSLLCWMLSIPARC
jgi:dynein heavy chain